MNVTSVTDSGILLSSITTTLSARTQSVVESQNSFRNVWNAQSTNTEPEAKTDAYAKQFSTKSQENTSDRIAGEGKADDRSSDAADTSSKLDDAKTSEKTTGEKTAIGKQQKDSVQEQDAAAENPGKEGMNAGAAKGDVSDAEGITRDQLVQAMESLSTLIQSFAELVQEVLGMNSDDFVQSLADLQMNAGDLLESQNLGFFVVNNYGEEESLSLLTNEDAFQSFRQLTDALEQLLQTEDFETGLDIPNLMELVEKGLQELAGQGNPVPVIPENLPEKIIPVPQQAPESGVDTSVSTGDFDEVSGASIASLVSDIAKENSGEFQGASGKNVQSEKEDASLAKIPASGDFEETAEISEMATSEGDTLGGEALIKNRHRSRQNQDGEGSDGTRENNAFLQNLSQLGKAEYQPENVELQDSFSQREALSNAKEIASQILDYMRTQLRGDITELEMQLHPASLGSVHVNLLNKDGMLTANFVTENEQVKAALEGQMIELQERFDEQGIKVQAIEVSVASHGFEQNLEQDSHREQEQEANRPRAVRRLQIGPDFGNEDLDALEEEDRLAAQMMLANGGTVDYHA